MGRPRAKPGIAAAPRTPSSAAAREDQSECKDASSQESDPCFHDITPYEHDQLDSASVRYLRPDRQFGRHTERRGWCETPGGLRDGPLGGEAPGCVTLRNCWATDRARIGCGGQRGCVIWFPPKGFSLRACRPCRAGARRYVGPGSTPSASPPRVRPVPAGRRSCR